MSSNGDGSDFAVMYLRAAKALVAARNLAPDEQSQQFFGGLLDVLLAFVSAKVDLEDLSLDPDEQ